MAKEDIENNKTVYYYFVSFGVNHQELVYYSLKLENRQLTNGVDFFIDNERYSLLFWYFLRKICLELSYQVDIQLCKPNGNCSVEFEQCVAKLDINTYNEPYFSKTAQQLVNETNVYINSNSNENTNDDDDLNDISSQDYRISIEFLENGKGSLFFSENLVKLLYDNLEERFKQNKKALKSLRNNSNNELRNLKDSNNESSVPNIELSSNMEEDLLLSLYKLYQFNNCDSVINFLLMQLCLDYFNFSLKDWFDMLANAEELFDDFVFVYENETRRNEDENDSKSNSDANDGSNPFETLNVVAKDVGMNSDSSLIVEVGSSSNQEIDLSGVAAIDRNSDNSSNNQIITTLPDGNDTMTPNDDTNSKHVAFENDETSDDSGSEGDENETYTGIKGIRIDAAEEAKIATNKLERRGTSFLKLLEAAEKLDQDSALQLIKDDSGSASLSGGSDDSIEMERIKSDGDASGGEIDGGGNRLEFDSGMESSPGALSPSDEPIGTTLPPMRESDEIVSKLAAQMNEVDFLAQATTNSSNHTATDITGRNSNEKQHPAIVQKSASITDELLATGPQDLGPPSGLFVYYFCYYMILS